MSLIIREYNAADVPQMADIWNYVVEEGNAFPQLDKLTAEQAAAFFKAQSFTGVAEKDGEVAGLYILHPNNVGRCGHISNASYAVKASSRGQGIGEALVAHSLNKGRELGFKLLQFNAVVKSNHYAIRLYEKLGFVLIGEIPGGFLMKDGSYETIRLYYHIL